VSGAGVDLSPRVSFSNSITGSPALAAETVVCTLAANNNAIVLPSGVFIGFCIAYTVGTSGASARYRIRQGIAAGAGTVVFDSGVTTAGITAAGLVVESVNGFDTAATMPGQAYCLTLTVGSGAAASTVSAASGFALFL
jgi:hypothetical protein